MKREETQLQIEDVSREDGRFTFTARSLSKDFECEDGLHRLASDSNNRPLVWRHAHPIQEGNENTHIYGRVLEADADDGYLVTKYEVYDHTQDHKDLQSLIQKRLEEDDPLGISLHYRKYINEQGNVVHYDVYEHSSTPFPACEECQSINYNIETKRNEENMPEKEDKQDEIKELEQKLNSKIKAYKKLENKLEDTINKMKHKDKKLEETKKEKESLESRMKKLEKKVTYLNEKKPIIDRILEIRESESFYLDQMKEMSKEKLEERLEQVKSEAESQPMTKSLEESAQESIENVDEENEEDVEYDSFVSNVK